MKDIWLDMCFVWLMCSFFQTLSTILKQKKKISIFAVCFDKILVIFISREFLCMLNFIFDSP